MHSFPASDFKPPRSLKLHRAAPCAGQSITNGDVVSRGSPSGTIGSENRAVTCRTCFTVACGEKLTTDGASPPAAATTLKSELAMQKANATAQRAIHRLKRVSRRASDCRLLMEVPPAPQRRYSVGCRPPSE